MNLQREEKDDVTEESMKKITHHMSQKIIN